MHMPLLHFSDRSTLLGALDLPLEPELHALIAARLAHLAEAGVLDMTELVVIDAETTETDLIDAIGWWPLRDQEGGQYGDSGFVQPFDHVYQASRSYHVAVQTVGNAGFAFELIVHDDAQPDLVALCREQAA
jgi:hypothetical protein